MKEKEKLKLRNEKNWLLELLSDVTNNNTLWRKIIKTYNVLRKETIISEDTPTPDYRLL